MQDSVATRTRTEMLSRQEKLGRDINLKKQLTWISMWRHTCLRNEHKIVVTKETLSRQRYHIEGKKNVATKNVLSQLKQERAQDLLGRDRQLLAATETYNENSKLSRNTTFRSRMKRQPGPNT